MHHDDRACEMTPVGKLARSTTVNALSSSSPVSTVRVLRRSEITDFPHVTNAPRSILVLPLALCSYGPHGYLVRHRLTPSVSYADPGGLEHHSAGILPPLCLLRHGEHFPPTARHNVLLSRALALR